MMSREPYVFVIAVPFASLLRASCLHAAQNKKLPKFNMQTPIFAQEFLSSERSGFGNFVAVPTTNWEIV